MESTGARLVLSSPGSDLRKLSQIFQNRGSCCSTCGRNGWNLPRRKVEKCTRYLLPMVVASVFLGPELSTTSTQGRAGLRTTYSRGVCWVRTVLDTKVSLGLVEGRFRAGIWSISGAHKIGVESRLAIGCVRVVIIRSGLTIKRLRRF